MIMGFCLTFIMMGTALMFSKYFMPFGPVMNMMFEIMGFGTILIGVMILAGRDRQTGAGLWMDLPSQDNTISIHSGISNKRLDPNAKFIKLKDIGLGLLKGKKKVFKDTGGGFRIAGHDVRRTHEKIAADLPEWLGQYLYDIKQKYMIKNDKELTQLYKELRTVKTHTDLLHLELLKPAFKDEKRKQEIFSMDIDDVKNLKERLFDGETVHMEEVENFIHLAKPNELDTWIDQEVNKNRLESRNYRDPGSQIDWNKWLPALGMFAFIAMLGTVILISYFD